MDRIGLFSEPGYTTISDPYVKEIAFRGKAPHDKGLKPLQIPGRVATIHLLSYYGILYVVSMTLQCSIHELYPYTFPWSLFVGSFRQ